MRGEADDLVRRGPASHHEQLNVGHLHQGLFDHLAREVGRYRSWVVRVQFQGLDVFAVPRQDCFRQELKPLNG